MRASPSSCRAPDVEQYHFIGKDIVYFHTLFWPAMLKFAGAPYKVPDNVFVHGFITASGEKMSKSRGTGISPDVYLDLGLEPGVAALLHRREAQRQGRGHRLQSRRLRRARSTAISSASTSTSRAGRRPFITKHFDGKLSLTRTWTRAHRQTRSARR